MNDPQRFNQTPLTDQDLNTIVNSLLGEPQAVCNKTGLAPFYVLNPAPKVNLFTLILTQFLNAAFSYILFNLSSNAYIICRPALPSGTRG